MFKKYDSLRINDSLYFSSFKDFVIIHGSFREHRYKLSNKDVLRLIIWLCCRRAILSGKYKIEYNDE